MEGSEEGKTEAAALVADLLSIPCGKRYPPLHLTEAVQKQRTIEITRQSIGRYRPRITDFGRTAGQTLNFKRNSTSEAGRAPIRSCAGSGSPAAFATASSKRFRHIRNYGK
jgi:hypothetical protein